ncbi:hypothetical protein HDU92_003566 [Lobulomyces angularis]|nr:hypothetical protein HDU92_003566 [Lobulomyces angularis]
MTSNIKVLNSQPPVSICSLVPPSKGIVLEVIVLEKSCMYIMKKKSLILTIDLIDNSFFWIADKSGSVVLNLYGFEFANLINEGDILFLINAEVRLFKDLLQVTINPGFQGASLKKIGEHTLIFKELPNLSFFTWENRGSNKLEGTPPKERKNSEWLPINFVGVHLQRKLQAQKRSLSDSPLEQKHEIKKRKTAENKKGY